MKLAPAASHFELRSDSKTKAITLSDHKRRMLRVLLHIRERLDEPLGLEELARHLKLGRTPVTDIALRAGYDSHEPSTRRGARRWPRRHRAFIVGSRPRCGSGHCAHEEA